MLKIISDKKLKNLKKLCKVLCKELNQKAKLSAELVFVEKEEIKRLNRETRNVDKVTDVLSYPTLDGIRGKVLDIKDYPLETLNGRLFLGSIVVCMDKIKEQAEEFGHTEEKETTYLILHGLLHLFGYDHMVEEDKKQMREKEKAVMRKLKLETNDD